MTLNEAVTVVAKTRAPLDQLVFCIADRTLQWAEEVAAHIIEELKFEEDPIGQYYHGNILNLLFDEERMDKQKL